MLELYVVTDWNQGVASLVEASSKSDAFRNYVLHTDVDMEHLEEIRVDYRGALSNRPFVEASVELSNHLFRKDQDEVEVFANTMIDRWREAQNSYVSCRDEFDKLTGIGNHLSLLRLRNEELVEENRRLREERRELGEALQVSQDETNTIWGLHDEANKCLRDLINEEIKTSERLRTERRELGGRNVTLGQQIDDLRHLIGYQEHELETFRHEAQKVKPVEDRSTITIKSGAVYDWALLPGIKLRIIDLDVSEIMEIEGQESEYTDEPVPMTEWVDEFNGERPE